jgi:hypothetical protein
MKNSVKAIALIICILVMLSTILILFGIETGNVTYENEDARADVEVPTTLWYYDVGEGVTEHIMNISLELYGVDDGMNHIRVSSLNFTLWVTDRTSHEVNPALIFLGGPIEWYSSSPLLNHDYDDIELLDQNWWAKGTCSASVQDTISAVNTTVEIFAPLLIVNTYAPDYENHQFLLRVDICVIYSRWWGGLRINASHQCMRLSYIFGEDSPIYLLGIV